VLKLKKNTGAKDLSTTTRRMTRAKMEVYLHVFFVSGLLNTAGALIKYLVKISYKIHYNN
jgi:hypothetical protein